MAAEGVEAEGRQPLVGDVVAGILSSMSCADWIWGGADVKKYLPQANSGDSHGPESSRSDGLERGWRTHSNCALGVRCSARQARDALSILKTS
jgi:hypothetical protein